MDGLSELAIFGAAPAFSESLHVGRPNIGDRQELRARINGILDRRWLTNNGLCVQEFEERITDFIGVEHCVVTNNATTALEIAARALGMGGEVIVPSMTFVATAHALQWQGIKPVFCDIDPVTHNIDPRRVEQLITPRTTGIIGVHVWGRPCDVEALEEISKRHNLKLLFDAAHAFGCAYNGQMLGTYGDAEVFSFHATKFLNSLEGGAVVTNDPDLARMARAMKDFGYDKKDKVISVGINGKMNEMSAAMGLTSLESLDQFVEINYRNYKQYQSELDEVSGVTLTKYDESEACNFQYIVLEFDEEETAISRDQIIAILNAENVLARRYFYPGCHRMEPYYSRDPHAALRLPETEGLVRRVITLPTGTAISTSDVEKICQIIRMVVANGSEVREWLEHEVVG